MMKMIRAAMAAALMLWAASASAYTDCQGAMGWIGSDMTTGHTKGLMNFAGSSGVGFDIAETAPGYKAAMQNIFLARSLSAQIFLRFSANGVSCTTYAYRTDLIEVWLVP